MSDEPPIPTPITVGGHGFPPADIIASLKNFLIPSIPSPGRSIANLLLFSEPNPLGNSVNSSSGLSDNSTFICGIDLPMLFPVFFLVSGSTTFVLRGTVCVAFFTPSIIPS